MCRMNILWEFLYEILLGQSRRTCLEDTLVDRFVQTLLQLATITCQKKLIEHSYDKLWL